MTIRCSGKWIYDEAVEKAVDIVAFDFDWWHQLAIADGDDSDIARPLGPDKCLYYVRFGRAGQTTEQTWVDSPGLATLQEAKQYAESRVPSSIRWSSD